MQSPVFEVSLSGGFGIILPPHIIKPFLDKGQKRVKVEASFEEKSISFHGAIQKRGDRHFMMFGKNNQKALGVFPNDYFQLQFFEDDSKYGVEISEELEAVLLSDYDAYQIFESFTKGKKRGIIYMISRYTVSQTRIDKSILLCENLKKGIRDNRDLLKSF
ncbi:YdeI/OmpD-associated family protein [Flavobacteriaceae bacterium TP-CH-4]|uniref:YdeI/OmpD-associated family protein n=1 Tax=Pelagihabitans pacificus TaxID=2696054 RepID=A0A967AU60_9FLAO|nr:YdeI/OmpD-associated family protein [Pelagihabitans pacificus]NHF59450.1 YdeI/OmpD-associated family protein [Pelagihabitans pacificus]